MKNLLMVSILAVGAFAFGSFSFAEDYYCGTIQASTSITGGEQLVFLTTEQGIFQVVSGFTETTDVQDKLNSLKKSLQAEYICVKTLSPILDDTILASGFTPFQPGY